MSRPVQPGDPRRMPRRRVALLVGGALALAAVTVKGRGRALDDRVFSWANSSFEHPAVDGFFRGVTELGSLWASIGAAGAIGAMGRRREAADALGAAVAMWGVGQGLKKGFRRLRPYQSELPRPLRLLIGKPRGASWPSSHPAVLLTFVTVAARNLGVRPAVRRSLYAVPGAVALSRVHLGVHYPADVVGGLLLGRAVADVWSRTVSPRVLH